MEFKMIAEKLRIFKLLLYKDFLVRKRHWKLGLFVELAIPLVLFLTAWSFRNASAGPGSPNYYSSNIENDRSKFLDMAEKHILVVPDNPFVTSYMEKVKNCLGDNYSHRSISYSFNNNDNTNHYNPFVIKQFRSEEHMSIYKEEIFQNEYQKVMSVILKSDTIFEFDSTTTDLDYKILVGETITHERYKSYGRSQIELKIAGLQLCLDESFIKMKMKNDSFKIQIDTLPLPYLPYLNPDRTYKGFNIMFCILVVLAFLIPLCIETSFASEEKFLGINVLMAMNGVPNYLNLLSWLLTGLIFSLTYIVPLAILVNLTFTVNAVPFLNYGNSFLFWLILTTHFIHLLTFGMHLSAYFTKSLFMVTAILVLYIGSNIIAKVGFTESASKIVPYFGILFPNVLLYQAFEEISYYESILKGIQFSNALRVGNSEYGTAGSVGIIIIFSILGSIFHFIMANYIYAINPGKYGVPRNFFYFLKFLKKSTTFSDDPETEKFESRNSNDKLFEQANENLFTPGIQIRNLKKTYNTKLFGKEKVNALKGISVNFYQKQITALLGHNGAGKTTMMSIITGMIRPSEGLVLVNGKNMKNDLNEIIGDMGLCPQENMFFPSLSVAEQLTFFALLKNKDKAKSLVRNQVTAFLQKLKLFEKRHSLPKQLSGGQKRRVCLGMALVGDSSTIILDEPTSGLDPESRRDIWDILLKMRGEKTILISTHDMEEADILGDRVAIVHAGTLRCYGTPMFLKKLLGQGKLEVTLSTESWCVPEKIYSNLGSEIEIINANGNEIQLSIPQSTELPDLLDKLEGSKKELGITGMSVSLITLEQVFIRVTEDENESIDLRGAFVNTTEKLNERDLFVHSLLGLLNKKMTYSIKNASTFLIMLILLLIPMFCIGFILMDHIDTNSDVDSLPINLNMYVNAKTFCKTNYETKNFGKVYKNITEQSHGKVIEHHDFVWQRTGLLDDLREFGKENPGIYKRDLIAGAEFQLNERNTLYTRIIYNDFQPVYSSLIAINLLTNTLLKTLVHSKDRIRLEIQAFPQKHEIDYDGTAMIIASENIEMFFIPIIFVCFFYPLVALFVIHPLRETLTNVKHLQRLAGASFFKYWGTMFLFDFIVMLIIIAVVVISFIVVNAVLGLEMLGVFEVCILILLFVLFAINILPLVYSISFSHQNTSAAIKLLSLLPLGLVTLEIIMTFVVSIFERNRTSVKIIWFIKKLLVLLSPYTSFFDGLIAFFRGTRHYGNCIRLSRKIDKDKIKTHCDDLVCADGICANSPRIFTEFKEDVSLEISILCLFLTPILYFGLLYCLEHKLIHRLIVAIRSNKPDPNDEEFEEQVKKVKDDVALEVSRIKNNENGKINDDNIERQRHAFLAFELRKLYGRFIAVQNISFGVRQGECFGLLGVNGAGKSTTFKIITGEEISHNGQMYLNYMDISKHGKKYISQMGYCPQNDAIIRSLNAYDHLRLFAHLRGVPKNQVNSEVQKWIDQLNLNACASQPSGTYSGGNKRRLNMAMALIGTPSLVLLDEPTTGVDPAARRSLWKIIQSCQNAGQALILTSHSMEECETLCSRLAIMVDGKFECIGASQELKQRFGAGYNVHLKLDPTTSPAEITEIKQDMSEAFECEVIDEHSGYLMFHLKSTDLTWRRMYDVVNNLQSKYTIIQDFSILSSTLEQLFLMFARSANKSDRKA